MFKRLLHIVTLALLLSVSITATAQTVLTLEDTSPPPKSRNALIAHNFTGANKLTIPATTDKDYVLTGTFNSTGPAVLVSVGFKGTITLNNVNITTTDDTSCIRLDGAVSGDLPIKTDATIRLNNTNTLWSGKETTGSNLQAAIVIKPECKLTIDGTGSLIAKNGDGVYTTARGGAPAIGATFTSSELSGKSENTHYVTELAGGDLVIKGGDITAIGSYHASGIGSGYFGGLRSITIVGGTIKSYGGAHGAAIGGGCYTTKPQTSLVVLPPAEINSYSAGGLAAVGAGYTAENAGYPLISNKMLIFYMGDPAQKKLRVTAQQRGGSALTGRQNVNILFDVSGDATISNALRLANLNPARWFAGSTGTQGFWETTGKIVGNVKVYSDTPTPQVPTAYYSSKRVSVPGTSDVHIILEEPDMSTPWLLITQDKTAWTNSDITLTVRHNPAIPYLTRMRPQGGTWVTGVTSITSKVYTNGTYYFEVENEDGNAMTVSHKVSNIDKAKPTVNVN